MRVNLVIGGFMYYQLSSNLMSEAALKSLKKHVVGIFQNHRHRVKTEVDWRQRLVFDKRDVYNKDFLIDRVVFFVHRNC